MLAKRGKGKFRRYLRGNIHTTLDLGALAATTGVLVATHTVVESAWISSIKCSYSMADFTIQADAGPILVGVAHSDYSLAEVEEWIENTGSWSEADTVQSREVGRRYIRRIGEFTQQSLLGVNTLEDGRLIRTKCGWRVATGQGLNFFCYNVGSAPVAVTTPVVTVQGHANLWPS